MANLTLVNLALKNDFTEKYQPFQQHLSVDGLQVDDGSLYFSDSEDEEFYLENSHFNTHTMVVPMTREWMTELQINMDDGYGPTLILRKFLSSLSECENKPPECHDATEKSQVLKNNDKRPLLVEGFASQYGPGSSHKRMRLDIADVVIDEKTPSVGLPISHIVQNTCEYPKKVEVCSSPSNEGLKVPKELHTLDDFDLEGWVFVSKSEVETIYESDSEDWTSGEAISHSHSTDGDSMEERLAHPTSSVSDGVVDQLSDRDMEKEVHVEDLQVDENASLYFSDSEDEKFYVENFAGRTEDQVLDLTEVVQTLDCGTVDFQLLDPTGVARQSDMYMYNGTEEKFQVLDPTKVDTLSWVPSSTDEEFQLLDPTEVDRLSDMCNGTEEKFQLLDPTKVDTLSCVHSFTEEEFQLLDPTEVDRLSDIYMYNGTEDDNDDDGTEEKFQLLDPTQVDSLNRRTGEASRLPDPVEVDQHSDLYSGTVEEYLDLLERPDSSTEEEFQLLDPIEDTMLYMRQRSSLEHEAVAMNRLSRYDLYYGPTHRVQSPSCKMIGACGDSRERSLVSSEYSELPAVQQVAPKNHKAQDRGGRTSRGTKMQTVTIKTLCYSVCTSIPVDIPSSGCPYWLLLMGLASLVTAVTDVQQKLGKLLEKSRQGQPHRQPDTAENMSYISRHSVWKTCFLLCQVVMVTDTWLPGIPSGCPIVSPSV